MMSSELDKLIEKARLVSMSPEDREAQRLSFAYGNTNAENPRITRESIAKAAKKIEADHESRNSTGESKSAAA